MSIREDRSALLARIDGSLQVQFNLARANNQRQWALSGDAQYSGQDWFHYATASSTFTEQDGSSDTSRNTTSIQSGRSLSGKWLIAGVFSAEQDAELGLDLRLLSGGGVGRRLIDTNRRSLQVLAGLAVTRERFQDQADAPVNLEGAVYTRFEGFRRRSPKIDATITFAFLPGLTDAGRVRGELNASMSLEVVHNFFLGLSGFDSFDTRPPDPTLSQHDYAVTPSLRWKF